MLPLPTPLHKSHDSETALADLGDAAARQPPAFPPRIVIVKRDRIAAEFIRQAVQGAGIAAEAPCFQTAEAALAALASQPAHLGIFGLTFADSDGLDLISLAASRRLVLRILVVSGRRDEVARQHLRPGRVEGFFDSETDDCARLPLAIRRVHEGGSYFSPPGPGATTGTADGPTLPQVLSGHELRILALLGDGCDDKTAAARLGLSLHTIHGHRQRIMRKLGVRSRTELMRTAVQRGLVRLTPTRILRPGFEVDFTEAGRRESITSSPSLVPASARATAPRNLARDFARCAIKPADQPNQAIR